MQAKARGPTVRTHQEGGDTYWQRQAMAGEGVRTNGPLPPQETPAPLACTSAWYDERTIGPEATWLKPSS